VIDAHVHLWQLGRHGCAWPTADLQPIYRDFILEDLPTPAQDVILVQTQEHPADTAWLLDLATNPRVRGVVGWADLTRPETFPRHPELKGLRPMVQDQPADWYDRLEIAPGLLAMARNGLVLDALIRPCHLPALARLAERHSGLQIVVDHAAKPDFGDLTPWTDGMAALAAHPNTACKLSGLLTELPPGADPEAIRPVFDMLWQMFGPDRLIWGSDWPVLTLSGSYTDWLDLARSLVPSSHHPAVFGANAARIYRLSL
jgi:L-fuconolactonase